MEQEKIILTIITDTYYSADDAQEAECAFITITQTQLDDIRKISEVVKENGLTHAAKWDQCSWYDKRPLLTFDELGDKFMVVNKYSDTKPDFGKTLDEYDADFMSSNETMDTEYLVVDNEGFWYAGYGKYSGNKTESIKVRFEDIDKTLADPIPCLKAQYYFAEGTDYPVELEDVPKYLNFGGDRAMKMYCMERLEKGE